MHLITAGLNHKTAPIGIRETCAFSKGQQRDIYRNLKASPELAGAVLVITCNRTEVYASAHDESRGFAVLEQLLETYSGIRPEEFHQYIYKYTGQQAAAHLFSVASGLDSMILGEQQILGQIKDAYAAAAELDTTDGLLNMLFQAALHTGKQVRTQTGIGRYPVSVSSAAVELCREIFGSLDDRQVLVVGAGDMAALALQNLMASGVRSVIVSNRCYERAFGLAGSVGGRALHLEAIPAELSRADIVIACTAAPHAVIHGERSRAALQEREGREIVLIDIAVPRDIDPELGRIPGVFLYDIDDLQNVIDKSYRERLRAAHQARGIIEKESRLFMKKMTALPVVPVIFALKQQAEQIKREELEQALAKLGAISEHDRQTIAGLAQAIVGRLLHEPVTRIKSTASEDRGSEYARLIAELFNLSLDDDDADHTARNPRQ